MIELLNTHHIYCKSDNLKIRLAVQNAEKEWNAKHHPEDLATVQKGAAIDTGMYVLLAIYPHIVLRTSHTTLFATNI